ncbi:TonB-dependent receptor [Sphingomonas rosea]|uniref:TonB-dependent receptor n=1 Tax=Sphingomonas rosea TaxID=335605 RepID=A0ABP7TLB3_9SPHN
MTSRLLPGLLLTISPLGLLAASPASAAQPGTAAQQPPAPTTASAAPEDQSATSPESTIVVTGTRRTDRTIADSPVPIDVIGSEALASSGLGETNKILNNLVPSFNFPQPSIADGTDVIRPASLRGLAPDQTLVLVNGKRRHVSSLLNINGTVGRGSTAVDLNNIPGLAIDRIEVLRDGASSQYGSDAIAGVINVRLRKSPRGGKAQVSYGKYITQLEDVPQLLSLQDVGGTAVVSTTDSRVLVGNYGSDRKVRDGALLTLGANIGVPLAGGYLNVTGEFRDRDATNRAGFDVRPNYIRPTAAVDPRELSFNRLNFRLGDPKTRDVNLIANAAVPIGADGFEVYSFATFADRKGRSAANYRQQSSVNNRDFSTITPSTTPSNANFTALTPDGFLPEIASRYKDWAAALGVRGALAGWNVDLSGVYGHNQIDYRTENSLNTSYGTTSIRNFDSGGLRFNQFTANLDVSREFNAGFSKPLSVAFGAEYRRDNFKERPGQRESYAAGPLFIAPVATTAANCTTLGGVYATATGICSFPGRAAPFGAQGFPGIPDYARLSKSRSSKAAYVELDTDPLPGLTTTIAGRVEDYSDFGSTANGKVALRYEFIPAIAIRGSVSTGFRAPSLQQQYYTGFSTNFINGLPVDIVTFPVSSAVSSALGAKPLKPEKSTNVSAGLTLNPLRGLTVTADYFHIKLKDRIVLTENLGAFGSGTSAQNTAVQAILTANNLSGFGAARFFINGLDTTTSGLDAVGTYRWKWDGLGSWSLSAAYNRTKNRIDRRLNALGPLAQIPGLVLFGRVEGIRFEQGQPRDKVVLSADGNVGKFGVTARTTRFGRVISPGAAAPLINTTSVTDYGPDDLVLQPKWISDLELRYSVGPVQLAAGANNLFDVYPTRRPFGPRPTTVGGSYPIDAYYIPYSGFSPFGFNGRFLYGRVSIDF